MRIIAACTTRRFRPPPQKATQKQRPKQQLQTQLTHLLPDHAAGDPNRDLHNKWEGKVVQHCEVVVVVVVAIIADGNYVYVYETTNQYQWLDE